MIGDMVNASMPDFATTGSNGTVSNFKSSPTLYAKFLSVVSEDNEDRGRPYCKKAKLSTLPGYQVISDPDLSLPGTSEENRRVKEYLESGYFYE